MVSPDHRPHDASWTLHDYLSLGEVEQGLDMTTTSQNLASEEIQRLPMLLRLLSTMRNLVHLPILGGNDDDDGTPHQDDSDPMVRKTVERLEHVAAIHSVAEVVDVVTCYLAPTITSTLSRVPPLTRGLNGTYDTTALHDVAYNHKGVGTGRKRQKKEGGRDNNATEAEGKDGDSSGGEADLSEGERSVAQTEKVASRKRKRDAINRRTSMELAAEDSQEATVIKTLSELIALVVASLDPIVPQNEDQADDDHGKDATYNIEDGPTLSAGSGKGRLLLTIEDSILAESGRDGTGGAMEFSDVGSTVAAILHYAPALKSQHVANALCRAAAPQLANLMTRIGANCPTSVPSLLLGCIQAHEQAIHEQNNSIVNASKQGVLALAKLSQREHSRALFKLQAAGIMWDVQIELAIQVPLADENAAARLLFEQVNPGRSSHPDRLKESLHQAPGENPSTGNTKIDDDEQLRSKPSETPLAALLSKQPVLYKKTLEYFAQQFQSVSESKHLSKGRFMLLLKGYSCLLLIYHPATPSKLDIHHYLSDAILPALKGLAVKVLDLMVERNTVTDHAQTSSMDSLIQNLHSALLLSIARIFQGASETETSIPDICSEFYFLLGNLPGQSGRLGGFRSGIEMAILGNSPSALHSLVVSTFFSPSNIAQADSMFAVHFSRIEGGWTRLCAHFCPLHNVALSQGEGEIIGLETTLTILLHAMTRPDSMVIEDSKVASVLKILLTSEQCDVYETIKVGDLATTFVSKATIHLVCSDYLTIPFIRSSSLELHSSCLFQPVTNKISEEARLRFLLQLLHAFEYLEAKPGSPFAFDPRGIPLSRVLELLAGLQPSFLGQRLGELARSHCAEVSFQFERSSLASFPAEGSKFSSESPPQAITYFYESLRSCVLDTDKDKDGFRMEAMFLQAKASLPESDLCCTVSSAFLASPHRPRLPITYHFLLRDPLVLLKSPVRIWRTRGLRRIALTVMSSLLASNAILARELTPFESSAEEYVASRDLIVIRCLLVCLAGTDRGISSLDCAMTSSMIRSMVAAHDGIVAALIKQGLPERALDWLIEFVPESMNDSHLLLELLSDRSPLTAAERLVASDAILRIAIMHGQSNDDESSSMASAALAQLVGSFFLVVGPVDVPVNALIVDDSGLDVTQIARKAASRMLEALLRVRGCSDGFRRKCGIALQKVATLCKNENSVVGAGALAGRRKALLKELYDLVLKASTNLGGVLGN